MERILLRRMHDPHRHPQSPAKALLRRKEQEALARLATGRLCNMEII